MVAAALVPFGINDDNIAFVALAARPLLSPPISFDILSISIAIDTLDTIKLLDIVVLKFFLIKSLYPDISKPYLKSLNSVSCRLSSEPITFLDSTYKFFNSPMFSDILF